MSEELREKTFDAHLDETSPEPARKIHKPTKTPMYSAINSGRYNRQHLIKEFEDKHGHTLICFVSGSRALIGRDDVAPFVDLLHNLPLGGPIDLLLHTPGGDVDAAEKLIKLVQAKAGKETVRVIVPDFAKSAGTLIAIGADSIVMSDSSELGTIDPQVYLSDGHNNDQYHSVFSYKAAYKRTADHLRKEPNDPVWRAEFDKFDPTLLYTFENVEKRARNCAENLLKRQGLNFSQIASELLNIEKYQSHGQMIGWEAAQEMGLKIEYLAYSHPDWQLLWELYCLLRQVVKDNDKIFESSCASLTFLG